MKDELHVTRKLNRMSEAWEEVCTKAHKPIDYVFQVLDPVGSNYQSYRLKDLTGFWDKEAFIVVQENPFYEKPVTKDEIMTELESVKPTSAVINPNHYDMMGANTIEILAAAMTEAEWRGFCLGNTLKYRIRAGKKDNLQQDIDKANNYERLYEKHKHLCRKDKEKSEE